MGIMDDNVILRLQRTVVTLSNAPAILDNQLMARDKSVSFWAILSSALDALVGSHLYSIPSQPSKCETPQTGLQVRVLLIFLIQMQLKTPYITGKR